MWFRVDDGFVRHEKVTAAARTLGGAKHIGRVVAVWLEAGLYASHYLTDGFVPRLEVELFRTDVYGRPVEVMDAAASAGLFRKQEQDGQPGYAFYKFDHYNPSAQDVKDKREQDRRRKASRSRAVSGRIPRGFRQESAGIIDGVVVESETIPRGFLAPVPVPVPIEDQEQEDQSPLARARRPLRMSLSVWNVKSHLYKAAHLAMDGARSLEEINLGAVGEAVKAAASQLQTAYTSREIAFIVDGAIAQRVRQIETDHGRARLARVDRQAMGGRYR